MAGNDANVESQKVSDDPVTYQTTNMPSDWQLSGSNLANASIGMIPMHNSMVESSPCSSGPIVVDSFCPPIWDMNGQSLGYCDVQNVAGTSSGLNPVRAGMGWNPNAAMLRGGGVLPYMVPGMLSQSLPQFPADSGFIERAARFSCFSGGNLGEMMNPFGLPYPYSRSLGQMQGPHEVGGGNGPKLVEMNGNNALNEMSLQGLCGTEGSPYKNEKRSESEGKNGANSSGNESDEAEFSGRGGQDGVPGGSSGKRLGAKKRKRNVQDITEHDKSNEASQLSMEKVKDTSEVDKQKDDQNPTSTGKPGGKNGKQGSQGSDVPKEDYIHMRARRGQATNSHSLAERVRREKISERMKFLQDLVPGCSKVTGKAVMLDEIINYVQSLQRQVEFLSMKLATVNPRLDFNNIEGLLAKDILQSRAGFPSSMGFHPDMTVPFPSPHPSQTGLLQTGLPGLGSSTELLRRPINFQSNALCGGFKEHAAQVSGAWEDELNNIVHMGFNPTAAHSSQDLSASQPQRNMKAEP